MRFIERLDWQFSLQRCSRMPMLRILLIPISQQFKDWTCIFLSSLFLFRICPLHRDDIQHVLVVVILRSYRHMCHKQTLAAVTHRESGVRHLQFDFKVLQGAHHTQPTSAAVLVQPFTCQSVTCAACVYRQSRIHVGHSTDTPHRT